MSYCIVLHCIVLYCIVLNVRITSWSASSSSVYVLYCVVLYCVALHCIVLHCIALHCIALYCIVLHCIVLYCIVRSRYLLLVCLQFVQPHAYDGVLQGLRLHHDETNEAILFLQTLHAVGRPHLPGTVRYRRRPFPASFERVL